MTPMLASLLSGSVTAILLIVAARFGVLPMMIVYRKYLPKDDNNE